MSYQRQSEIPKKGRTEQEQRVERLLRELGIPHQTNQVVCFKCYAQFSNPNGDRYPDHCINCFQVFDDVGLYCMPDFIITNDISKSVLNINGGVHEKTNKHIKKDRFQMTELKAANYSVSILKNEEIDNMTNATLKAYLFAIWKATFSNVLHAQFYRGEKEYSCLR